MKKLTKILVILLSMALILGAFVIAAAAADTAPAATTADVFDIYDAAGNKTESKNNVVDALKACPDGGKIVMTGNYEHGPKNDRGQSINLNNKAITLDLAGKTLAFSYNSNDEGLAIFQQLSLSKVNFTITSSANGAKIVSGCSVLVTSDGNFVLDGTNKPITCQAIAGWNNSGEKNGFQGGQFFKIGANTGANADPVAEVKGSINYDLALNTGGGANFFGVQANATLNVDKAKIVCTNAADNIYTSIFTFLTTYTAEAYNNSKDAIKSPTITITNSTLDVPSNALVDFANYASNKAGYEYSFDKAPVFVVDGCTITAFSETRSQTSLFRIHNNPYARVKLLNTKIKNGGALFEGNADASGALPNVTVEVKGCNIEQTAWAYAFNTPDVSVKMEDTVLFAGGNGWIGSKAGYAFKYSSEIQTGEAVPAYADPANAAEPWFFGGYGRLLGENVFVRYALTPATDPTSFGVLTDGGGYDAIVWRLATNVAIEQGRPDYPNTPVHTYNVKTGYETWKHNYTFEGVANGVYMDVTASPSIGGASFIIAENTGKGGRDGKFTVTTINGNTFVKHEHHDSYINGSYIDINMNNGGGNSKDYKGIALDKHIFYSIELDIASPDWKFAKGTANFGFYIRDYNTENGALKQFQAEAVTFYTGDSSSLYVNQSKKYTVDPTTGEWTHVQVILAAPVVENNKDTVDYSLSIDKANFNNFTLYLYINGEYFDKKEGAFAAYSDLPTYEDYKKVAVTELRVNFPDYSTGASGSTAYDNVQVKRFGVDYTGGAKNYEDTLATVVNKNYTKPERLPFASLEAWGDVEYYNDMEELMESAAFYLEEDDVFIELFKDFDLPFNPEYIGDDVTLTVKTNGFKFVLDPDSDFVAEDNEDGTLNVRYVTDKDYINVTWLDMNGETIKVDTIRKNAALTAPTVENNVVRNEYYRAIYGGWAVQVAGEEGEFTYVTVDLNSFTSGSDVTLKMAATDVKPTFTGAVLNYGLNDNLILQIHVPADFANNNVRDDVKFTEINIGGNRPLMNSTVNGQAYRYANSYPLYDSFATSSNIYIKYVVTLDGVEFALTQTYSVCPLKYCEAVLADAAKFSAEDVTLVANFLRYGNEFIRVSKNGTYNETLNAAYKKYASYCSEYEESLLDPENKKTDYSDLSALVESIYVKIASGRAQYGIDFKAGSKVTAVSIRKTGYVEGGNCAYGAIYIYGAPASRLEYFTNDGTGVVAGGKENASAYLSKFFTENVKPFNFFGELEITITYEVIDPETEATAIKTATGTYDICTWYNGISEADQALWGDLFLAYKELADSQTAKRFVKVVE